MATDNSGVELQTQPVCTHCECGKIYDVIVQSVGNNAALTEQNEQTMTSSVCMELAPKVTAENIMGHLNDDTFFHWNAESISILIKTYKEHHELFSSPIMKKRKAWEVVALAITNRGISVSWQQCESKWKNLMRNYRKIKNDLNTLGKTASRWPYYKEINEIHNLRVNDSIEMDSANQNIDSPSSACDIAAMSSTTSILTPNGVETGGNSQRGRKRKGEDEPAWFHSYRIEVQKRHEQRMALQRQIMEQHKLLTRQLIKVLEGIKK